MGFDREALQERICRLAKLDGGAHVILLDQVHGLAVVFECSVRDVELAALDSGVVPWRYIRSLGTLGLHGQAKLLRSTVAVVGLGGLGGYVAEALARPGGKHYVIGNSIRHTAFVDGNEPFLHSHLFHMNVPIFIYICLRESFRCTRHSKGTAFQRPFPELEC